MRIQRKVRTLLVTVALFSAGIAVCYYYLRLWREASSPVPSVVYTLRDGRLDSWEAYGGSWQDVNGIVHSNSSERGAKLLNGSHQWANYTLNADMRFDGVAADMGVIIRSNDEREGVDAYNGYFVGLRSLDGTLVIGHSNYAWVEATPVVVPGGVQRSVWYRLTVTAYGCNLAASAENLTTFQTAWVAFEERSCVKAGRIGLRSLNANGLWRNIRVNNATWNDYLTLKQHAGYVEQPNVLDGPPWWTPWHVVMLFAGALAIALMIQLVYFRIQQWKSTTILSERERLAHEIHDTMAQSFAGVGYQIQGIRSSVLRSDDQDSVHIAEQLSVAYQLVRRCHEEASRTIAMLGSPSSVQENLLGALASTAHRIVGDKIITSTELGGDSTPLNLRLANALLHIGQEAIANAVNHADPTLLKISLIYEGNRVELVVEDNGRGFEYTTEKAGFGILGMQKRARDVAGTLQIVGSPGHGTQVRVKALLEDGNFKRRFSVKARETLRSVSTSLIRAE